MTDWPRIQTYVDDDRPARQDEVEYCEHCGEPVLRGDLEMHCGRRCCPDCCHVCEVCHEADVSEPCEFCETCAMWALGVEV